MLVHRLIQTQYATQQGEIFRQRRNRAFQRVTVGVGQFVVGFKPVFGAVLRQNRVNFLEVGIDFRQQRAVFFLQLWTQQVNNLLRAVDVGLAIPQVGVAVAVFFTADLARRHFFNQASRAAHHF